MVHGACSSSGCYAMTDQGMAEIYPIVQHALAGGQRSFQVQAFPFRMTAKTMARNRNNENFAFWKTLKVGYDAFELAKSQPKVSICGGGYVFNTEFEGGEPADPLAMCPAAVALPDPSLVAGIQAEQSKIDALVASGYASETGSYLDGGMHESFRSILERQGAKKLAARTSRTKYPVSRPEAALADPH